MNMDENPSESGSRAEHRWKFTSGVAGPDFDFLRPQGAWGGAGGRGSSPPEGPPFFFLGGGPRGPQGVKTI